MGENIFKFDEKCLFYKHWILYVKDLYESNGYFISTESLLNKLTDKRNWMSEYTPVKKTYTTKVDYTKV